MKRWCLRLLRFCFEVAPKVRQFRCVTGYWRGTVFPQEEGLKKTSGNKKTPGSVQRGPVQDLREEDHVAPLQCAMEAAEEEEGGQAKTCETSS